jgi:hypothetical protein
VWNFSYITKLKFLETKKRFKILKLNTNIFFICSTNIFFQRKRNIVNLQIKEMSLKCSLTGKTNNFGLFNFGSNPNITKIYLEIKYFSFLGLLYFFSFGKKYQ